MMIFLLLFIFVCRLSVLQNVFAIILKLLLKKTYCFNCIVGLFFLYVDGYYTFVQYSDLTILAGTSMCWVNNLKDKDFKPFEPHEVCSRALYQCETVPSFNLITKNSEHFATWCRYGTKISYQSTKVVTLALGTGVAVVSGSVLKGVAVSVSYFIIYNATEKIWNRFTREWWSSF